MEADVEIISMVMTKLPEAKQIEMMDKLIENIEDMDDVQNVYHNREQERYFGTGCYWIKLDKYVKHNYD